MTLPERSPRAAYLGDAVYVDEDSYGSVILTTEDGISVSNRIVLEPDIIRAFKRYLSNLDAQRKGKEVETS